MATKPTSATPDVSKLQADALAASNAAATKTLDGIQKLVALNMQTARASLEQSSEQINALLSSHDTQTLAELVTSFAKLSPEKFAAYAKAVYAISSETSSEIRAMLEKQVEDSNAQLAAAVQSLAKSAPGGTNGAMDFISQSMGAARKAYDQMQTAAQQFADQAAAAMPKTGDGRSKKG